MERGEVWWAGLESPEGSEPGFRRPVLIVQANGFNRSRIKTVIAVAITSNLRLADAPGNVRLSQGAGGLSRECVANVSQLVTLDRSMLVERLGKLNPKLINRIDAGLKLVLGLAPPA